jgi:FkbM family methyltransferase
MMPSTKYRPLSPQDLNITTVACQARPIEDLTFTVVIDSRADDPLSVPSLEIFRLVRRIVPAGSRVLDLGGHVGAFSLAAAAAGYQVVTVEASPRNAALLQASVDANNWQNIRIIAAGVSDAPGTIPFIVDGPYGHVAMEAEKGNSARQVEVPAITVDQLLSEVGWDRPDFVKMDIEGSEVAAIEGMPRLLAREDAPLFYYESNSHTLNFYGETPQTLKAAFAACGYRSFLVQGERLVEVQPGDIQGLGCVDHLAFKAFPATVKADSVRAGLTEAEIIAFLQDSAKDAVPNRLHAVRAIAAASERFRQNPDVRRLIRVLQTDQAEEVRTAAATLGPVEEARASSWFPQLFSRKKDS